MSRSAAHVAVIAAPLNRIAARFSTVVASHCVVDVYSALLPALLLAMKNHASLTSSQTAWLLAIGSVASGASQPLCAWISDRLDWRGFGPLGLVVAATCMCSIGLVDSFGGLVALVCVGTLGVGIFHPIGASTVGQLAESGERSRRSIAISIFFVAGMIGGVLGSKYGPWIVTSDGGVDLRRLLPWMIPGLLAAIALHVAIRRVPHRHANHRDMVFEAGELAQRWLMVGVLYLANVLRFTVNMALLMLYNLWAEHQAAARLAGGTAEQIATAATRDVGGMLAWTTAGMAMGGLGAGALIRSGREKWPMVIVPLLGALAIWYFPYADEGLRTPLIVAAAIGFAAMIPVSLGTAQRMLPHRTGLASGLMLGGAWMVAFIGPRIAEHMVSAEGWGWSFEKAFAAAAIGLVAAGLLALVLNRRLLIRTGR